MEEIRVIKKFKPFRLGFCACGCGQEIDIRRHSKNMLYRYMNHHWGKGRKVSRQNNKIENLEGMLKSKHTGLHNKERYFKRDQ